MEEILNANGNTALTEKDGTYGTKHQGNKWDTNSASKIAVHSKDHIQGDPILLEDIHGEATDLRKTCYSL